jgi:diguanylate cyclase (GGDEF)-like protein
LIPNQHCGRAAGPLRGRSAITRLGVQVTSFAVEVNYVTSKANPQPDAVAVSPDPYRGAQHDVAVRMTGAMWVIGPLLMLAFLPSYPPTAQIGGLGWVLVPASIAISVILGFLALTLKLRLSWTWLHASSFHAITQIAFVQWLAGGGNAPYIQWLILPMLAVATHRAVPMVLPVLALGAAAAFSPLLYGGIDVAATVSGVALISTMSIIVSLGMTSVRDHRAELRDERELAASLARVDKLTGLPNRRAFEEALEETVESFGEQGRSLAVLICDADNFKQINDTFGHPAGDGCLREIATALDAAVRLPDRAYRWAGDEFAVILHDSDSRDADVVGMRVADAIEIACRRPDGQAITIGTGGAELEGGMTADHLLAAADAALLERKAARRRAEASPVTPEAGLEPSDENAPNPEVVPH